MRLSDISSMTGQSRAAAASRLDSESSGNGSAGGPEPPRLDVSGTDRSPAFSRYSDSEEGEDEDEPDNTIGVSGLNSTNDTQIMRCYRCEAVSEYSNGNPLQVLMRISLTMTDTPYKIIL